jgi:dipeptidyl aminopeptidase/acylaminoacyl peptidase
LLGGTITEQPENYKRVSPINYVSKNNTPVLIIHGEIDNVVPIWQSEAMYKKLKEAGVDASFIRVNNLGHALQDTIPCKPSYKEIMKSCYAFFDKHLK